MTKADSSIAVIVKSKPSIPAPTNNAPKETTHVSSSSIKEPKSKSSKKKLQEELKVNKRRKVSIIRDGPREFKTKRKADRSSLETIGEGLNSDTKRFSMPPRQPR